MLAATVDDVSKLVFPLIGTPKIDGIRCITLPPLESGYTCHPVSRTLKSIANRNIYRTLAENCPPGLDGELIVPGGTFQQTQAAVMAHHSVSEFEYHVFDQLPYLNDPTYYRGIKVAYRDRLFALSCATLPPMCRVIPYVTLDCARDLESYEESMVSDGYEGICLRTPHGIYKFGRSSLKEHWLMKMKRFVDDEGTVVGYQPLLSNQNGAAPNALGYKTRRSLQENMVPQEKLGALMLEIACPKCEGSQVIFSGGCDACEETGAIQFSIGSGLNDALRYQLWDERESLIGRIVKYKYQPHGTKDKPRTPIFLGFREIE
jgi:DNA ligase-1